MEGFAPRFESDYFFRVFGILQMIVSQTDLALADSVARLV
jgi:hypothetical protein